MSTGILHSHKPVSADDARIRRVDVSMPMDWLASGWQTFMAAPFSSLLYGALFSVACLAAVRVWNRSPGRTGPFLAAGLYAAACQHEQGKTVSIGRGFEHVVARSTNLSLFAVFLALVMAAWIRLSALIFAVNFSVSSPSIEGFRGVLTGQMGGDALAFFLFVGFLLALTVFITSAVAIPMIMDRDVSPMLAIHTSAKAVAKNWPAMAAWAALIVALTGVGILTFFLGMVVLFPLLGYATWHSYRAMVR